MTEVLIVLIVLALAAAMFSMAQEPRARGHWGPWIEIPPGTTGDNGLPHPGGRRREWKDDQ